MFKVTPLDFPVRYEGVTYFVGDIFTMDGKYLDENIVKVVEELKAKAKKTKVEGE